MDNQPYKQCFICRKTVLTTNKTPVACQECKDLGEATVARMSVIQHLWQAAKQIFNFRFWNAMAELKWAQERLFKTGDYHPKTGKYYKKGYLKD